MNNKKYKILIVDDVKENVTLVNYMLNQAGYATEMAYDGYHALDLASKIDFDLILLDIMMPEISGTEVCRFLKAELKTALVPVIFLTADTSTKTLTRAYEVGASDYLRKPFIKSELLARVDSRLKLRDYEKNLEKKVEDRTKEISETQVQLMHVLGGIAEGHSQETHLHVKRVTDFSYKLAILSGMKNKEALMLKDASSLHDVGKLGILDSILHKPGKLTGAEYKEIKKHAALGGKMLEHSELPLFKVATIVATQHHEKWDGTGYPEGLKGTNIHIYGRIVAIADVFDALSFKRAYKDSWSEIEVLAYMKDMSAKHFDPELMKIFFDNINDFLSIYNTHVEKADMIKSLNAKKRGKIMSWLLDER